VCLCVCVPRATLRRSRIVLPVGTVYCGVLQCISMCCSVSYIVATWLRRRTARCGRSLVHRHHHTHHSHTPMTFCLSHTHTHAHAHTHTHTHAHTHTLPHAQTQTHTHTHTHKDAPCLTHASLTHTNTHTHTHTLEDAPNLTHTLAHTHKRRVAPGHQRRGANTV